jgi:hypothetical protein
MGWFTAIQPIGLIVGPTTRFRASDDTAVIVNRSTIERVDHGVSLYIFAA